jgi:hypothetical protein
MELARTSVLRLVLDAQAWDGGEGHKSQTHLLGVGGARIQKNFTVRI